MVSLSIFRMFLHSVSSIDCTHNFSNYKKVIQKVHHMFLFILGFLAILVLLGSGLMNIYNHYQCYEICRSPRKAYPYSQGFLKMLMLKASYIVSDVVMIFKNFFVNKRKPDLQTLCRLN